MPQTNEHHRPAGFDELGISANLLQVVQRCGFTQPTPIQLQAIPIAIAGKDVIGIAQTGTGKTLAFGIPMLQRLIQEGGRGLVIVPTRELAYQVEESLLPFAQTAGIRMAVFVGGASMIRQREMIRRNPRILVATPGRLNDHLQQGTVTLREVKILVLDEADRMLDMGFKPQIDRILEHVPRNRQTMLFSATMPPSILKLATSQMTLPLRIEVAPAGTAADRVEQEVIVVRKEEKMRLLETLLTEYQGTILLFSRTKHGAKKIARSVNLMGHKAAEIHSNRTLPQRREALEGFKSGRYRILVATDIAARGIDVTGIELVINFDLPDDPGDYVHRIGRTARAGREGKAISFAGPDQSRDVRDIERLIRTQLPRRPIPALAPARAHVPMDHSDSASERPVYRGRPHGGSSPHRSQQPRRQQSSRRRPSW